MRCPRFWRRGRSSSRPCTGNRWTGLSSEQEFLACGGDPPSLRTHAQNPDRRRVHSAFDPPLARPAGHDRRRPCPVVRRHDQTPERSRETQQQAFSLGFHVRTDAGGGGWFEVAICDLKGHATSQGRSPLSDPRLHRAGRGDALERASKELPRCAGFRLGRKGRLRRPKFLFVRGLPPRNAPPALPHEQPDGCSTARAPLRSISRSCAPSCRCGKR